MKLASWMLTYLTSLSFEAVPYLIELRDKSDSNIKMVIDENLKYRKEVLDKAKFMD